MSPGFTMSSVSVFDFSPVMFTVSTVVSGFSSPTVAMFLIAPLIFSTTIVKLISPSPLAGTEITVPSITLVAVSFEASSIFNIPSSTNFAKDSSLTFALPSISSVFTTVIV